MKSKLLTAVALAAAPLLAVGFASNAMATVELNITDVTTGATTGNLVGTPTAGGSTITFGGAVGNWGINVTGGVSILGLPLGPNLDLSSIDARTATSDTLNIKLSDNGYTTATSAFNIASVGNMIACATAPCTATVNDYFSTTNNLFAETSKIDGTLGPFSASYNASSSGAGTSVTPYSLTIDLTLTGGAGATEWSTDSSIRGVIPEPASLTLLGGALVGLGWLGRRRKTM